MPLIGPGNAEAAGEYETGEAGARVELPYEGSAGLIVGHEKSGPVESQIAESTEADNLAKLSQEGAVARVVVDIPVGGDKHLPVGTEAYAVDWAGNAEAAGEYETGEAGARVELPYEGSAGLIVGHEKSGPVESQIAESTEADNLAKLSQEGAVARVVVDIPVGGDKHLPVGTEAYAVDWARER